MRRPGKRPFTSHQILFSLGLTASLGLSAPVLAADANTAPDDYFNLSLEDLLQMEVTSVSKKKQNINEVASAIFVITQEDIRRSGVTSIPEALRMAPGIQVARMDANKWAVTSRGFNHQFANKLLVMIDGRSVYTPSFSGVYWDVQDTMLEDIDRIEIIRGPGATIWGANAVNGVINIITKSAHDTDGALVSAGAGNEEKGFVSLRYGKALSEHSDARVYAKFNRRDNSTLADQNAEGKDGWDSSRVGFRLDNQITINDAWTLQGDVYDVDSSQTSNLWVNPYDPANAAYAPYYKRLNVADSVQSNGWNLLTRWDHQLSEDSNTSLQVYFDRADHSESLIGMKIDTFDVDFRHQVRLSSSQDLIWGLGYRLIDSDYRNGFLAEILPAQQNVTKLNLFVQDEIDLSDQLKLTLGAKLDKTESADAEFQPSMRLLWVIDATHTLWGSISCAARTPSAVEKGSMIIANIVPAQPPVLPQPLIQYSIGNDQVESEQLTAYEIGYRFQTLNNLSIDATLFYNDYSRIQTISLLDSSPISNVGYSNDLKGSSTGAEISIDWRAMEWWRLQTSYSSIDISVKKRDPNALINFTQNVYEESAPRHLLSVRSLMDLAHDTSLDLWLYYSSQLDSTSFSVAGGVPAYSSINARFAWRPHDGVQLSLVGRNLNQQHHAEFIGEHFLSASEIERSIYAQLRIDF